MRRRPQGLTSALWPGLVVTLLFFYVSAARPVSSTEPSRGAFAGGQRSSAFDLSTTGVLTYHNDGARTGQNLTETILTPATVSPDHFGLLKTDYRLDGAVLAQPLYVPNVFMNGPRPDTRYNLVIVVTAHDTVYAFDADADRHPQHWASPLWTRSLLQPGAIPVPGSCEDIDLEVGITSTPVIDPITGTLYVVAKSQEADGRQAFTLYALDVASGLDALTAGGPVRIVATDPVSGAPFSAVHQHQRAGLALVEGVIYVAFASNCDRPPYHGWLLGYDTTRALAPVLAFNTSPGRNFGGIWASGAAPAIDTDASLFFATGNGPFDPAHSQWGDSILKMPGQRPTIISSPALTPLDYFAPFNRQSLDSHDLDLGSSGVMLVPEQTGPHPHVLIAGSKQGLLYVVDRDQMTSANHHTVSCSDATLAAIAQSNLQGQRSSYSETCDPILQAVKNVPGTQSDPTSARVYNGPAMYSTPAYWNGSVYIGAAEDQLKRFALQDGRLVNTPRSMSPNQFAWPGVTASISANGQRGGIVWVVDAADTIGWVGGSSDTPRTSAVLYAFDATDLSHVLYQSSGTPDDERNGRVAPNGRDLMTIGHRFSLPTVYGGKVFVATRTHLHVFGVL